MSIVLTKYALIVRALVTNSGNVWVQNFAVSAKMIVLSENIALAVRFWQ